MAKLYEPIAPGSEAQVADLAEAISENFKGVISRDADRIAAFCVAFFEKRTQ